MGKETIIGCLSEKLIIIGSKVCRNMFFFFFLKTQSINEIKFNGALEEQGSVVGGSKRERELKLRETKDGKMYKVKGQDAGSITQTLIVACQ